MTHVEGNSTSCPQCGQLAQLRFFEHTDEQGHPLRQEFEFTCPRGHTLDKDDLVELWAATHAVTG
ncbi:MAG TPA: hypothetical protein VFE19_05855 [Jatrophihabitantaceae bacterium]|jgi:hypothetical protein|nr:hypothetical protein [Jatrophihabitantaceae bacterium]